MKRARGREMKSGAVYYEVSVMMDEGVLQRQRFGHDDAGLDKAFERARVAWEVSGWESLVELVMRGDRFFLSNFGPCPLFVVKSAAR